MKPLKLTLTICIALTFTACGDDDDDRSYRPDIESLKTSVSGLNSDLEEISSKLDQLTTLINAEQPTTLLEDPKQDPSPRAETPLPVGRIAFESNSDIYTIDADGKNLTNLTNHLAGDFKPVWNLDGEQIAFISDRAGLGKVFVMNADGTNQRLFVESNRIADPKWSPHGGMLVFTAHTGPDKDGIHIGGNIKPTFLAKGSQPTWSVLGQIAFVLRNESEDIYVMNAHGGDPIRITDHPRDEYHPAWSSDGQFIAYTTSRVQDWKANWEIFVMSADGTNQRNITQHPGNDRAPTWSPDGKQIAFMSNRDDAFNWEIYVMNADGTNQRNITNDATTNDMYPDWQPR